MFTLFAVLAAATPLNSQAEQEALPGLSPQARNGNEGTARQDGSCYQLMDARGTAVDAARRSKSPGLHLHDQ